MPEKPTTIIADAIRRERALAQMSLSALAARANLAKSTLSQLESGKGNPNVETLWAIATALGIPFSALFESASTHSQLIRVEEGVELTAGEAGLATVLLDKCPPDRRRDLYRVRLRPGSVREAEAHPRGTVEHAFVCNGRVRLGPAGGKAELGPGDYFRYDADIAHSYEALGGEALILVVMESGR
ncbi:DNA-binding protein [Defluviimonas sp. 20V17]|uniref:DNA-binding protein n=1 Tax=Allgaiera indica TaxID=765699 RepID=A0AAN4UT78_9RHOB|nr:XRE family transcriptional regulator [Allgaiera indica]KDB02136.1 DNA-binding protein [Defluviimonas sp. 20V17]GHE02974.1 DNA-binding protein [Allgaiera indica]SDX13642.1 transcriptional regulator, XRE family with cupin sensor [Allgaiera indica]